MWMVSEKGSGLAKQDVKMRFLTSLQLRGKDFFSQAKNQESSLTPIPVNLTHILPIATIGISDTFIKLKLSGFICLMLQS
jgi:hypothetical protein